MMIREKIQQELNDIPDVLLEELYDYLKFLKHKKARSQEGMKTAYASEKVLSKDWDTPEENQIWENL